MLSVPVRSPPSWSSPDEYASTIRFCDDPVPDRGNEITDGGGGGGGGGRGYRGRIPLERLTRNVDDLGVVVDLIICSTTTPISHTHQVGGYNKPGNISLILGRVTAGELVAVIVQTKGRNGEVTRKPKKAERVYNNKGNQTRYRALFCFFAFPEEPNNTNNTV